jgi:hypothetical protein
MTRKNRLVHYAHISEVTFEELRAFTKFNTHSNGMEEFWGIAKIRLAK